MNIFQNTLRVRGYIDFLRLANFQQILTKSTYLPHGLRGKLRFVFSSALLETIILTRLSFRIPSRETNNKLPSFEQIRLIVERAKLNFPTRHMIRLPNP